MAGCTEALAPIPALTAAGPNALSEIATSNECPPFIEMPGSRPTRRGGEARPAKTPAAPAAGVRGRGLAEGDPSEGTEAEPEARANQNARAASHAAATPEKAGSRTVESLVG